jgi:hypothetical protein
LVECRLCACVKPTSRWISPSIWRTCFKRPSLRIATSNMTTLFEKWFQSKLDEELEMHCSQIPKLMKSYRLVLIQINIDSCLWFVWLSSCFMSYRYLCLLPVSLRFAGILFRFSKPQTQTIKSSKFCMSIHTSMIII